MSFHKLVILAVSLVFAAQGAMAAPAFRVSPVGVVSRQEDAHKHGDAKPEPILDSTLQNVGDIVGVIAHDVLPEETTHEIIHGAGGAARRQEDAHKDGHAKPQPILDSTLENVGDIVGVVVHDVLPEETTHEIIHGAGGAARRQEDAHKDGHAKPQPILDSTLENVGDIVGVIVHDVLPEETTHEIIKGASGHD